MLYAKYDVRQELLPEYYEDFFTLEDWIPFIIKLVLPTEICLKVGSKVKDKKRYTKIINQHRIDGENYEFNHPELSKTLAIEDWQVEEFLKKYPKFKPLFVEIDWEKKFENDPKEITKAGSLKTPHATKK